MQGAFSGFLSLEVDADASVQVLEFSAPGLHVWSCRGHASVYDVTAAVVLVGVLVVLIKRERKSAENAFSARGEMELQGVDSLRGQYPLEG
jgi:hypothetical protein